MTLLFADTETYSETPIKNGTGAYAADAEVMLFAYALDAGPVDVWDKTEDPMMPQDLYDALRDPTTTLVFHNAMFDRTVIKDDLNIEIPFDRLEDTMVRALAHSLPGALGTLCEVLQIGDDQAKDKRGRDLINLFCKPRPKNQQIRRFTRETHPKEWQEFKEYAASDIEAMRAVYYKLPSWNYRDGELALWRLDQRINGRGFLVDTDLARCAIDAVTRAQAGLAARTSDATFGLVESATKRDKLLRFILEAYGVELPDMQSSTLERRMNDPELPKEVVELLAIRLESSKASTSKYQALVKAVSADNRLRYTLQFCGASRTGRDAGRTWQPQNLPRPTLDQDVIDGGIAAIKAGCADLVYNDVMSLTSNTIRGCIIAPPGKKLVISDLSNIEGRFCAWLAGEEWKLKAFRDFDQGIGHDLYKIAYAKSFNVAPESVTKPQRQIGKVQELMLQYEGGVGAFVTGAAAYNIDLDEMAAIAWPLVPVHVQQEAQGFYEWTLKRRRTTFGLEPKTFMACDALKRLWREAHPKISSLWGEWKEAFTAAIYTPEQNFYAGKLVIRRDGVWHRVILPSGRALCYPSVRIDDKGQLSYAGVNPYSRKWSRIKTYGGKGIEQATQGGSRDVFKGTDMRTGVNCPSTLHAIEDAGYEILLSVHDELITEAPDTDEFSADRLSALMADAPSWAQGLPLAAAGFECHRYRKDQ